MQEYKDFGKFLGEKFEKLRPISEKPQEVIEKFLLGFMTSIYDNLDCD